MSVLALPLVTVMMGKPLQLVDYEVASSVKGQLMPVPRLPPCKEALDRMSRHNGGAAIRNNGGHSRANCTSSPLP